MGRWQLEGLTEGPADFEAKPLRQPLRVCHLPIDLRWGERLAFWDGPRYPRPRYGLPGDGHEKGSRRKSGAVPAAVTGERPADMPLAEKGGCPLF
jgi:hypothetical protein